MQKKFEQMLSQGRTAYEWQSYIGVEKIEAN